MSHTARKQHKALLRNLRFVHYKLLLALSTMEKALARAAKIKTGWIFSSEDMPNFARQVGRWMLAMRRPPPPWLARVLVTNQQVVEQARRHGRPGHAFKAARAVLPVSHSRREASWTTPRPSRSTSVRRRRQSSDGARRASLHAPSLGGGGSDSNVACVRQPRHAYQRRLMCFVRLPGNCQTSQRLTCKRHMKLHKSQDMSLHEHT